MPNLVVLVRWPVGPNGRAAYHEKAMRNAREKSKGDVRETVAIQGEEKGGSEATN